MGTFFCGTMEQVRATEGTSNTLNVNSTKWVLAVYLSQRAKARVEEAGRGRRRGRGEREGSVWVMASSE